MIKPNRRLLAQTARAACAAALVAAHPALAASADSADSADQSAATPTQIVVTAHRLDDARESIKPSLGASTYTLDSAAIQNLPGSDNQPIQDIILQMPGVSQDQFGQFHVRDEHNGVQYRINGVIIPESIAVFGQTLSPRLIETMSLVTGTLPAQYGLRTAGILDITTKSGLKDETTVGLYGGSHDTIEPSVQLTGSSGPTTWFVSGDYKHSDLGIDNVNSTYTAVHDNTEQFSGFGYIDRIVGDNDRIAFTAGYSNQHYQIPDPAGPTDLIGSQTDVNGNPVAVNGVTSFNSANLNEQQLQTFGFGALSWLHSAGAFSFQASVFARLATLDYRPDYVGELLFNGLAQAASKNDTVLGGQVDGSYKISGHHTLRFGALFEHDRSKSNTDSNVFPVNDTGLIDGPPESLVYITDVSQRTFSAYLQDEWHVVDTLVLNYGARFDENDGARDERQLSPRVNMVWTPASGTTVHAGYARYFAPAPFELVASRNIAQVANTTLAPAVTTDDASYAQRENYWDIGIEQKIGRGFTVGLDGYLRRDTNMVDEGQFGAPIILTPFNYAKGRLMGAELTANYHHAGFSAYGNFALQKGQGTQIDSNQYNFTQAELNYIATHYIYLDHDQTMTASAGAAYNWTSGALAHSKISADMVYGSGLRKDLVLSDGSDVPNGAHLPGYATVNMSIGHTFVASGLDVRVVVENLFDKIYEIRDGTGVGVGAPSYGPRRGLFFGISKTL